MATCPNCNHNPMGFSSSWMYLKRCKDCGRVFCHKCGRSSKDCPGCGSKNVDTTHKKIHGH